VTPCSKILLTLLVVLAALSVAPSDADARRGRSLLGALTAPLRAVGGAIAPRRFGLRPHYYKGRYARGPRRAVVVQRTAPASAPVAVAAGAAGAAAAGAAATPAPSGTENPSGSQVAATTPQLPDPPPLRSPLRQTPAQPQAAPARPQQPTGSGWRGPLYWPYASDDLFDYALQPASDWFWTRGGGDLIDAVVMRGDDRSGGWADMCGSRRGGSTAWIEPITQALDPTEPQTQALDQLRDALVQASNAVKIACPATETSAHPVQRLQQMVDRVWTLRHAVTTIRPALEAFVASLSDPQRTTFDAMRTSTRDTTASINAPPAGAAQACADPSVMAMWPGDQIEARVRPSPAQREALRTMQMTTLGMAQFLMASCPSETPRTALARLDAAEKRLNALLYAVRNLTPAVAGFYGTLTQEQRMALHALGQARPGRPDARGSRGGAANAGDREGRTQ
jgi:LTXXQ motif family protein